jgi:predicted GNAT family N-acyltransferase
VSTRDYRVRLADWSTDRTALMAVRREVFVVEQLVPEALEWDDVDAQCRHVLAQDDADAAIGCGRLLPDGHIGRLAVRAPWRGRGVGAALLERLLALAAEEGHRRVVLNAQKQAMGFYVRYGFAPSGPEFDEAGIPHLEMARPLR